MDGTTAIVLIRYRELIHEKIQVINLGDCRAIMSSGELYIPLSVDHKPDSYSEKIRIIISIKKKNW